MLDEIIKQVEEDLVLCEGEGGWVERGGKGSGHWGHGGRKGKRGGSAPRGAAAVAPIHDFQEFKPRKKDAVYGVKSGSFRVVVFEKPNWTEENTDWMGHRYTLSGRRYMGTNELSEAKKMARDQLQHLVTVKGWR